MTRNEALLHTREMFLNHGNVKPWDIFATTNLNEIKELYKEYVIIQALRYCKYNITRTTKFLHLVGRQTVADCAQKYNINCKQMKRQLKTQPLCPPTTPQ